MDHILVWNFGVSKSFEEAFIFVNSHFTLFAVPDGSKRVDGLAIKFDRVCDKLREFFDHFFDDFFLAEFAALRGKLHHDTSSTLEIKIVSI